MNYKLLSKHVEKAIQFEFPKMEKDGSNAGMFFCADVVGARRFATNFGGYPASDIAEINRATSLQEQLSIMQTLSDYSPVSNPNAGLSDAEIMLGHKSKYLQSPSEVIGWLENQIKLRDAKRLTDSKDKSIIEFDSGDSPKDNIDS